MNATKVITQMRQSYATIPHIHTERSRYHFFFGDETALDLYTVLKDEVEWYNHKYIGVLELPYCMLSFPERQGLMLDVVQQGSKPASRAIAYLEQLEQELWSLWKKGIFYLAGKDDAVNEFERALWQKDIVPAQIMRL